MWTAGPGQASISVHKEHAICIYSSYFSTRGMAGEASDAVGSTVNPNIKDYTGDAVMDIATKVVVAMVDETTSGKYTIMFVMKDLSPTMLTTAITLVSSPALPLTTFCDCKGVKVEVTEEDIKYIHYEYKEKKSV